MTNPKGASASWVCRLTDITVLSLPHVRESAPVRPAIIPLQRGFALIAIRISNNETYLPEFVLNNDHGDVISLQPIALSNHILTRYGPGFPRKRITTHVPISPLKRFRESSLESLM